MVGQRGTTSRIRAWELGGTGFRAGDSKYGEGEEAEPERHRRQVGRPDAPGNGACEKRTRGRVQMGAEASAVEPRSRRGAGPPELQLLARRGPVFTPAHQVEQEEKRARNPEEKRTTGNAQKPLRGYW